MKRIVILGSTGSIGKQTLDIVRKNPDKYKVTVLSCASKIDELKKQIDEFKPETIVVDKETDAQILQKEYPKLQVSCGSAGLIDAAASACDIVVNSLMGIRGLAPTYHAIIAGNDIAFANKETLVAGGKLIMGIAKEKNVQLLPVDSEHSAIFQCMRGNDQKKVRRLIITASGGPFRGYSLDQLKQVTLEQALKHPKWTMGQKITIDSATMMNKGLEIIEARWLFDMPLEKIDVVVHPQSIVHSMVEYEDKSIIAQLGLPDMRVPISYALGFPDRISNDFDSLNFFGEASNLTFEKPDMEVFKCMKLACDALKAEGSYTVALNGANEELVKLFLQGTIRFIDIQDNIDIILQEHVSKSNLTLDDILQIDRETREKVHIKLGKKY